MPTRTITLPETASDDHATRPEDEIADGQSSVPAIVLGAVVALSYSFLIGTFVGHVM
jgi:hypothetical protein